MTLKENEITRYLASERVTATTYWKGLTNRGIGIANSYFLDLIEVKPGDTIVDCGANIGDLELYFRIQGIPVNYIGFEPSPKEFECLSKNISQGRAYNLGLWDSKGSIPFYISIENSDGSFIRPPVYTEIRQIQIARLDSLVTQRIRFLKVEAEGGEPEVIRGCEGILSNIEWISVDVGFERGLKKEHTLVDVSNYLIARNFTLTKFIAPSGRWTALFRNNTL